MNGTTDAAKAANGEDVSLTNELPTVDAYATISVTFRGNRYPVGFGYMSDEVDRCFWRPSKHTCEHDPNVPDRPEDADPVFGSDVTGELTRVGIDEYVDPNGDGPHKVPYEENDVPAVMLWSAQADEYMVVRDRDTVVVEAADKFGGVNRHEVEVVGMSTGQYHGNDVKVTVRTEDGSTKDGVDPTMIREVVARGPEWVRDPDGAMGELVRADK